MGARIAQAALPLLLLTAQVAVAGVGFVRSDTVMVPPQPEFLAVGDLNEDGLSDVVVVSPQRNQVSVFLCSTEPGSPGRLSAGRVLTVGEKLRRASLGDLNEDGKLDLVVADEGAERVWYMLGRGDGTFEPPTYVSLDFKPVAVALGDFDGEPGNDLAIADRRGGSVYIRRNDGSDSPIFRGGPRLEVGDGPEDVVAVDFDGDHRLDLAVLNMGGSGSETVTVLLWKRVTAGLPIFERWGDFITGEKPSSLDVADVNNDGLSDLVMLSHPTRHPNSYIKVLLSQGDGSLSAPLSFEVPCPFYTGEASCRSWALAARDFDGNGHVDLAVALTDPGGGVGSSGLDAMQLFVGRGDGQFVPGAVLSTGQSPLAMVAGEFTGDDLVDLAVSFKGVSSVETYVNVSTSEGKGNGNPCGLDEECASSRCVDGVCCAAARCEEGERCDVRGREGTCQPIPGPVGCTEDGECLGIPGGTAAVCVDGFCCENACEDGRCDVPGAEGLCITALGDGSECAEDAECRSGFCRDGRCCQEECADGRCDNELGICEPLGDLGDECNFHEDCRSDVCDILEGICCERFCDVVDEQCNQEGRCEPIEIPPLLQPGEGCESDDQCETDFCLDGVCCLVEQCSAGEVCAPGNGECQATPAAPDGAWCAGDAQCISEYCVNGVCCTVRECGEDEYCAPGTGQCEFGTLPPTPSPTATPTVTPTPLDPCEPNPCDPQPCIAKDGGWVCIKGSSSSGCSIGSGAASVGDLLAMAFLPVALWLLRRWDLQRPARLHVSGRRH